MSKSSFPFHGNTINYALARSKLRRFIVSEYKKDPEKFHSKWKFMHKLMLVHIQTLIDSSKELSKDYPCHSERHLRDAIRRCVDDGEIPRLHF
jgi:hypothetical protein